MNVMIQKSLPSKGSYQKTQVSGFLSAYLRDFITNLSYLRISFFKVMVYIFYRKEILLI